MPELPLTSTKPCRILVLALPLSLTLTLRPAGAGVIHTSSHGVNSREHHQFDHLECFIRNPRQALSRAQLIEHVWGEDYFDDDNVVDVYVRYRRKKLEDIKPERVIQTIRGVGFALKLETLIIQ